VRCPGDRSTGWSTCRRRRSRSCPLRCAYSSQDQSVPAPDGIEIAVSESSSSKFARQLRFLVPVVLAELGFVSLGFVDAVMVSRYSPAALAACSLGITFSSFLLWFGAGVAFGAEPLLSQAYGNRDLPMMRSIFRAGVKVCVLVFIPMAFLSLFAAPVLTLFSQPPELIAGADMYAKICIASLLPAYLSTLLQGLLLSAGLTLPIVRAMVIANIANVGLNQVLIHGAVYGVTLIPGGLGVAGAAIATSCSRVLILCMLVHAAIPFLTGKLDALLSESAPVSSPTKTVNSRSDAMAEVTTESSTRQANADRGKNYAGDVWNLGLPIGTQMLVEWGAFALLPLVCGSMSNAGSAVAMGVAEGASEFLPLVVHTIANSITDLMYMIPLGLSNATCILCARSIGERDIQSFESVRRFGLRIMFAYGIVATIFMSVFSSPLSMIFSHDSSVLALSAAVLPAAGVYMLCDGMRTVLCGILKSAGLTKFSLQSSLLAFWVLGLPMSLLLAFPCGLGVAGLWLGLAFGNACSALLLMSRIAGVSRDGLEKYALV